MLENLFINVLEISITSTAAMAAILLISKLAENKFRKKWRYWIWIFLAIYLVLPIKIDLPSAPIQMDLPPHEMIITQAEEREETAEKPPLSTESEQENNFEHAGTASEQETPALSTDAKTEETEPKVFVFPIVFVGAIIWIAGAVIVCGWNIAMYIRFSVRSKLWNRKIKDEFVLSLFEDIKKEMGIPEKVKLYENRLIKSPMMVGFAKPRVLLPSEALLPEEYEFVLRHELTHYKRGDIGYKFLLMLAASIHWFNPAIGFMCRNAEKDIEITCDEAVVKAMEGDRRQEYCATILNIMRRGQNSPLLLSTSFYGGKKFLKSRFAAVLNPKTHRGIALFILAAIVILISGTMVACNEASANNPPKTEEQVLGGALEVSEIIVKNRDGVEEADYSEFFSKECFGNIERIVSASREYMEYNDISYEDYEINVSIDKTEKTENRIISDVKISLSYIFVKEGFAERRESKNETVKLTYDADEEKFIAAVMYDEDGKAYTSSRFTNEIAEDIASKNRPEVTGPDEEGKFPFISDSDWDRWVTYNGVSQTEDEKPTEPIPSVLESEKHIEYLKAQYPSIRDWEVVYEEADYELLESYDPYTYCYRNIYMPVRFAVLKTEQSDEFDRVFITSYEYYYAHHTGTGYIPQVKVMAENCTAFEADVQVGGLSGAEIQGSVYSSERGIWFPAEEKYVVTDFSGQKAVAVYGIEEPIHVFSVEHLKRAYSVNDTMIDLSESFGNDFIFYYSLDENGFKTDMITAYYDFETKSIVPFEGLEDYVGFFAQFFWLNSEQFIIEAEGILYFYNSENPTKLIAKIGGNGNGAYEGKVTSYNYIKEDKTHEGRYAWLYNIDETQEHGCVVFDGEGNIIENFTFGLYGGYIGSYSFHDGLIYFSFHGSERFNYAVDARPGKDHVLQANAW